MVLDQETVLQIIMDTRAVILIFNMVLHTHNMWGMIMILFSEHTVVVEDILGIPICRPVMLLQ